MKTYLKTARALALGAAMALTGTVHAGALATSVLEVSNGVLINDSTGNPLLLSVGSIDGSGLIIGSGFSEISQASGNNTGDVSADLTSIGGTASGSFSESIIGGGSTNLGQVSQGAAPVGEDNYQGLTNPIDPNPAPPNPEVTAPVANNFAMADQALAGNIVDIDLNGDGIIDAPAGVSAQTRADVGLLTTDTGSSTSNTGADVSMIFTTAVATTVTFSGDFIANLEVWLNPDVVDPSTVQAAVNWSISIEDLSGGGFTMNYAPGQVNQTISRNVGTRGIRGNYDFGGTLSATSGMLTAGNLYQLTISHTTRADATKTTPAAIPEPTTLALLGIGMLGFVAKRRFRKSV